MNAVIDLESDRLEPINVIAHRRTGRKVSPSTLHRWRLKGVKGAKLEAVYVSGLWCTTEAAFADFLRRQTEAANAACTGETSRTPATERRLRDAGLLP